MTFTGRLQWLVCTSQRFLRWGENAAAENRERILAVFERSVAHREVDYPMPHTQYEADSYAERQAQDRSQVVQEIAKSLD